ncbi:carnitinyl-CoA dehydratase [Aestuariispira ectoiniformans]|uniref:carnitinyl-CoA dehydratase n=1 Tax=Aestuariispira ectoiniformans TaxID=2775080 RepID=UPI00223AD5F7|nr:carnitinyl-CoA dehydratase [Aestuariispira ectoiniformans]
MSEKLKVTRNGAVLEVVLNRPKANAIDAETSREMGAVFEEFRDDDSLRVAILTGEGEKFFSAGWDLNAAAEGEDFESDYGVGGFGGFTELRDLNKPVIAAVNGMAVGGGFEIALAADMIVAADHSAFFLPEAFVGVIPDAGTVRLPKILPPAIAREILMTGRRMSAAEAAQWGIVNAVVPADQVMDKARELASSVVSAAPLAIGAIKELMRGTDALSLEAGFEFMRSGGAPLYKRMLESEDAQEGPKAFSEKREPVWKGR